MSSSVYAILKETRSFFSEDYASARRLFLQSCAECELTVDTYRHPLAAETGFALATDTVWLGDRDASRVLILISGTHGLEGTTGSGVQVGFLRRLREQLPEGVAVLCIHMLNPWGAAMQRRQTEDNVDLNRNFHQSFTDLPDNPQYEQIHELVTSSDYIRHGDVNEEVESALRGFRDENGDGAYHTAMFQGQYTHPDGAGFGGDKPTWSNQTLHKILGKYALSAEVVAVIDIHTGLGPYGYGVPINTCRPGSVGLRLASEWYGPGLIASAGTGDLAYEVKGDIQSGIVDMLPAAVVVPVALEYGTYPIEDLMQLQIQDCWLHRYGDIESPIGQSMKRELMRFFYPATPDWLESVYMRAEQCICHALFQLSSGMSQVVI